MSTGTTILEKAFETHKTEVTVGLFASTVTSKTHIPMCLCRASSFYLDFPQVVQSKKMALHTTPHNTSVFKLIKERFFSSCSP